MTLTDAILELYIFILAGFVGFMVITRVPPLLHTPLMSATNAISRHLARRLAWWPPASQHGARRHASSASSP